MQQRQQQREHDDLQTGHDLPNSDGTVSDEDVKAIDDSDRGGEGGQDHSLDNYSDTIPTEGVGGVQDASDPTSDIARFRD
jgi:hypothetical protein